MILMLLELNRSKAVTSWPSLTKASTRWKPKSHWRQLSDIYSLGTMVVLSS